MLGNLAKKLRLFGFDVIYYKSGDDEGLLKNFKDRILLTCDKELYKRSVMMGRSSIFIERAEDEVKALAKVFEAIKVEPKIRAVRCTVCNGKLRKMSKDEVANSNSIPEGTKERYKEFYVCTRCGKVYWFGSHWKNIMLFEEELKKSVSAAKA